MSEEGNNDDFVKITRHDAVIASRDIRVLATKPPRPTAQSLPMRPTFSDEDDELEGYRDRRLTLPTVFVSNNQNNQSDGSDFSDSTSPENGLKSFQSSPNLRQGFRRKGQRRKTNLKRTTTHLNSRIGSHSPLLTNKSKVVATLERSLSRSAGNLLSESEDCNSGDEVWAAQSRANLKLDLGPAKSLPRHLIQEYSPSPSTPFSLISPSNAGRRRSSILNTLSGMLSKSQNNLLDITDEVKNVSLGASSFSHFLSLSLRLSLSPFLSVSISLSFALSLSLCLYLSLSLYRSLSLLS